MDIVAISFAFLIVLAVNVGIFMINPVLGGFSLFITFGLLTKL